MRDLSRSNDRPRSFPETLMPPDIELHSFPRPTELFLVVSPLSAVCPLGRWLSNGSSAYKAMQLILLPMHPFVRSRVSSSGPITLSTMSLTFLHVISQCRLISHQLNTRAMFYKADLNISL